MKTVIKSKSLRTKKFAAFITVILLIILFVQTGYACGTIELMGRMYWNDINNKKSPAGIIEFLSSDECVTTMRNTYRGRESDIILLGLVLDILKNRHFFRSEARQIFIRWNCLYGARDEPDYKWVARQLGTKDCNNRYKNWLFIKAKRGAFLRQEPKGTKLTILTNNTIVNKIEQKKDCIKVKVVRHALLYPATCKFKSPCNEGYVHKSLLEEY